MWLLLSFISGLLFSSQQILTRYVLKGSGKDAWAFSFFASAVGTLVSLPFILLKPQFGLSVNVWIVMIMVGLLIVLHNWFTFKSASYLPPSITGSLTKFRLIWIFIIGIVILGEAFSFGKVAGTLMIIIAGAVIVNLSKKEWSSTGIIYIFIATLIYGVLIMLYKFLYKEFNADSLTFFIFFIPALFNLMIMPKALIRIKRLYQTDGLKVISACIFGGLATIAMNYGLFLGEASRVVVIIESFLMITLAGESIFLKEKISLKIRLASVLLTVFGAVLVIV